MNTVSEGVLIHRMYEEPMAEEPNIKYKIQREKKQIWMKNPWLKVMS